MFDIVFNYTDGSCTSHCWNSHMTPPLLPLLILQITLAVCFILMFGNSMLLTSFYASSLVSIWVSWTLESNKLCAQSRQVQLDQWIQMV